MKSVVAMTYYQLMHSIALALTFDEKPNLYFFMSYINADDDFIERIKESKVFRDVIAITKRGEHKEFLKELRKTRGAKKKKIEEIGASLFEKYLEPHYAELFEDADFDDDIYVYNDFQWHYYYISKHFDKVIGVEDGYASLEQQLSIHRLRGDAELIKPFVKQGYYPEPLYRDKCIKRIISSKDFGETLDNYYREKLQIWDFKDIVAMNEDAFKKAILFIFQVDKLSIRDNSTIYLGQPLDRAKYCTYLENYLLTKKIIRSETEKGRRVFLKPHPAERNDTRIFIDKDVEILKKDFPVEVLNYQEKKFERLVTFSSTGASLINCANEEIRNYEKTDTSPKEVTRFIKEQIKGEKIDVDFFFTIKNMSPDIYMYVYSSIFRHRSVHTRIHLCFERDKYEQFSEYFDISNLALRIKEYRERQKNKKSRDAWYLELLRLPGWIERYNPDVVFHSVSGLDEWTIFDEAISRCEDYDYSMLIQPTKMYFILTERIFESFETLMFSAIYFENYTSNKNKNNKKKRISLKPGYISENFGGSLMNVFMHRAIVKDINNGKKTEEHAAEVINDYSGSICRKQGEPLYMPITKYTSITDGEMHFKGIIDNLKERYRNNADDEEHKDYLLGQMANTVYDYYNWYMINEQVDDPLDASIIIQEFFEDDELENAVLKKIINGLFFEKALADRSPFFQKRDYYMGLKDAIDCAAENGTFKRVILFERVKNKLSKKR